LNCNGLADFAVTDVQMHNFVLTDWRAWYLSIIAIYAALW